MYAFDASVGTQSFYTMLQQYDEWTPAVHLTTRTHMSVVSGLSPGQLSVVDRHTGTSVASYSRARAFTGADIVCFLHPCWASPGACLQSMSAILTTTPFRNFQHQRAIHTLAGRRRIQR